MKTELLPRARAHVATIRSFLEAEAEHEEAEEAVSALESLLSGPDEAGFRGASWYDDTLVWTHEHGHECHTELLDGSVCTGYRDRGLWRNIGTPVWAAVAVLARASARAA